MKLIIGGSIAVILGLICLSVFFSAFLTFLAGSLPLVFIIIGCLTIYLKREDEASEYTAPEFKSDGIGVPKPEETKIDEIKPENEKTGKPIENDRTFIGNTGSYVFHSSGCKFSKSKNCTSVFNTREEAIQEGFKPCGICKP